MNDNDKKLRAALRQPCPLCEVPKGEWCVNRGTGHRTAIHEARHRRAEVWDRVLLMERQLRFPWN